MPDPIPSSLPRLIQGGMGVGVSSWRLARAVASRGHLGVVSGTAIDAVFVRRLQDGDPGGHLRRAMARFPVPRHRGGRAGAPLPLRRPRRWAAVSAPAHAYAPLAPIATRRVRPECLCRGEPRQGGARQPRRHQPVDKGATSQSRYPVRGHPGRRRLRPDGRRHPPRDPRSTRRVEPGPRRIAAFRRHRGRRFTSCSPTDF